MNARFLFPSMILLALSACGSPNDPGVGGVTKAEAEQLNEAAEALNQDKPLPSLGGEAASAAPIPPDSNN